LSTELTEYLYNDKKYNKPFFTTYVKTSLFAVYLLGFIACKSWRQHCHQLIRSLRLSNADIHLTANGGHCSTSSSGASTPLYSILDSSGDQLNDESLDEENCEPSATDDRWQEQVLSEPVWVPIKFSSDTSCINSERSSGTDGTESDSDRNRRKRCLKRSNSQK